MAQRTRSTSHFICGIMTAFIARAGHFMLAFAPSSHLLRQDASGGSKADLRVACSGTLLWLQEM